MSLLNTLTSYKKQDKEKSVPVEPVKPENKGLTFMLFCFSLFSVIFATSILSVLDLDYYSFTGVTVISFLLFILIINEILKVKFISSLYEVFKFGVGFHNLILTIVTIGLSLSSLFGIYFTTNKINTKDKESLIINLSKQDTLLLIKPLDSLIKLSNSNMQDLNKTVNPTYYDQLIELKKQPKYLLSKEDELLINDLYTKTKQEEESLKISLQNQIIDKTKQIKEKERLLKEQKNTSDNRIWIVAVILVCISLIVEIGIAIISYINGRDNYLYKTQYEEYTKQIEKLTKEKKETIENHKLTIQFRKYMALLEKLYLLEITKVTKQLILDNSDLGQKETDLVYSLFKNLGILSNGSTNDVRLDVSRDRAIEILDEYYTKQLSDLL